MSGCNCLPRKGGGVSSAGMDGTLGRRIWHRRLMCQKSDVDVGIKIKWSSDGSGFDMLLGGGKWLDSTGGYLRVQFRWVEGGLSKWKTEGIKCNYTSW
ncbi:hypothetical protein AVEN_8400-1 [Araneus ventricosus]|uniref:Uncharacterized protein n=1 Tax=Araneus ventricosus TaxID=182803 RepID=A0A4Y2T9S5_ARAVE|nr:hypothetical protein AVEN_181761-1 [Araneus ventricosus]GBN97317.1 hypothetical protein AVEN_254841-1 [Araneus ventricosus]GBO05555.1 hypothetical protein AVEN_2040-1 [Araneus ventricosus]GBO05582.1 hypothetical protein AVEN_8400-1 [Araneus ventricosus]